MNDETKVIKNFIQGDAGAFEKLVLYHRESAQEFAKRYVYDHHIAEDIVQDAFVSCYMNRKKYKHSYSFKSYLYTIVRNKCVDYIRSENKKMLYHNFYDYISSSAEEEVLHKESISFIRKSIDTLHKPYKQAIHLVDIDDFTYKEAANIMGKSLGTFKITLYRARKQLKEDILKEVSHE